MDNTRRIELLCCLLQIQLFAYSKAYEINYFANDKGWRPISMWRQQVHEGSPYYIPTTSLIGKADYLPRQADDIKSIDKLKSEAMKLVKPYQVFSEFSKTNNETEHLLKITNNIQRDTQEINGIKNEAFKEVSHLSHFKIRQAKTISERNSGEKVMGEFMNHRIKDKINKTDEENDKQNLIISASPKTLSTYAVSENYKDTENHLKTSQTFAKDTGYFYKLPTKNQLTEKKSNISATFLNLLSKYKINNTDYSRNYALSRNTELRNYFKPGFVFLPSPMTAVDHRNSAVHLPVNPLLAVYLSNYGYYLPGSYGPRNQFRNLYGYLASNNIHNNRPFGPYKVFSDWDSSNK